MKWPRIYRGLRPFLICFLLATLYFILSYYHLHTLSEYQTELPPVTTSNTGTPVPQPDHEEGDCYPSPDELADFPNCKDKWKWLTTGWTSHACYKEMGVNGSGCSIRDFLSNVENHCPIRKGVTPFIRRQSAKPNFSKDELFASFKDKPVNYEFIKQRINRMWSSWIDAYNENNRIHSSTMNDRPRRRIIIHMGFLMTTKFGELSSKGGPLGELVQWSDLIASLHILGHDLLISTELTTMISNMNAHSRDAPCPNGHQLDIIITDIMGLRTMIRKNRAFINQYKCRLRILDSFGTQAEFNIRLYFANHKSELGGKANSWGGFGLHLRQFLTLYPHSHDNTFLGFVVNTHINHTIDPARTGVLVYGKEKYMWEKAEAAVKACMEITQVHATVADSSGDDNGLPTGVINHGLLSEVEFHALLSNVKIFLGLGFPFEGPAPLEAVAHGTVFINHRFDPPIGRLNDKFFAEKPTLRALTSQSPYLEEMGEPWVITVNTSDTVALKAAIEKALRSDLKPRLPVELTASGMLLRVSLIIDRLDTCNSMPQWPPPSAVIPTVSKESSSCTSTCSSIGLRCDSALFPLINNVESLEKYLGCSSPSTAPSLIAPSRCSLQESPLFYSCSSSIEGSIRLCPCRDFISDQHDICTKCL